MRGQTPTGHAWNFNPDDIRLPGQHKAPTYLTRQQLVAKIKVQNAGNPDLDINKVPAMVQRERFEHDLPLAPEWHIEAHDARKRDAGSLPCDSEYFSVYKERMERIESLTYELIGSDYPASTCMTDVPEFIVCSDENLYGTTFTEKQYPAILLDYRGYDELQRKTAGSTCSKWWVECPTPATSTSEIHLQIDRTLQDNSATRIYMKDQAQLNGYLAWRLANGTMAGFSYVRVSDKISTTTTPAADNRTTIFASIVGAVGGSMLLGLGGYLISRHCKDKAAVASAVATTTTPLPSTAPAFRQASPSSMGNMSSTITPAGVVQLQPAPPAPLAPAQPAAPVTVSSDSSSLVDGSDTESVAVDIPPAGHESSEW